jgi:HAD superfamily hydrolase (TIGR01509 family)
MTNIECIIFDLDDTLIESEPIWAVAYAKLYKVLGQDFYRKDLLKYLGMTILDVSRDAHSLLGVTQFTVEECAAMLRKFLLEGYDGNIKTMPGVTKFLQKVNGRYKMSIASGSPREAIVTTIKAKGWEKIFTQYVSSEEVEHGKPEPDVFLEAARRLGCKPEHTLVIEDGVKGIIAAKKAGMVAFYVKNPPDPEAVSRADRYFLSMKEIQPSDLQIIENNYK